MRICAFESRRGEEMRSLIERQGGNALIAPSMKEIPLEENGEVFDFVQRLLADEFQLVIFLTGVGARALLETAESRFPREEILAALRRCRVAVRGPKPLAVMREWKVDIHVLAPEPNTWRELMTALKSKDSLAPGANVALQEYGVPSVELHQALREAGVNLTTVSVYRWGLPDNLEPLRGAIREISAGRVDCLMFTSAQQIQHVLTIAETEGSREAFLEAAKKCLIASIGPTTTETLQELGLRVDLEPEHPKMGHLVKTTLERGPDLLKARP